MATPFGFVWLLLEGLKEYWLSLFVPSELSLLVMIVLTGSRLGSWDPPENFFMDCWLVT